MRRILRAALLARACAHQPANASLVVKYVTHRSPPSNETRFMNFFYSFDAEYYLGLALCSMLSAFSIERRRGRGLRFFVLHRPPLTADVVCSATRAAFAARPEAAGAWTGCGRFRHAANETYAAPPALETVNAIELVDAPPALARIAALSASMVKNRTACANRAELADVMNLAPDAMDAFLWPLGVRGGVAALDADARPSRLFDRLFDANFRPARPLAALARPGSSAGTCSWSERFNLSAPLVRSTLGATLFEADQRRFKASVFVAKDLARFRALRVADRVADLLERHLRGPGLWGCTVQQAPLVLAVANHTELVGSGGRPIAAIRPYPLEPAPPGTRTAAACAETITPYVDPEIIHDDCKKTRASRLYDANQTLSRVVAALAMGDPEACTCARKEKDHKPHRHHPVPPEPTAAKPQPWSALFKLNN